MPSRCASASNTSMKTLPMRFRFSSGSVHLAELRGTDLQRERRRCSTSYLIQQRERRFKLPFTQQTVIDKDARLTIAYSAMDQGRRHSRDQHHPEKPDTTRPLSPSCWRIRATCSSITASATNHRDNRKPRTENCASRGRRAACGDLG